MVTRARWARSCLAAAALVAAAGLSGCASASEPTSDASPAQVLPVRGEVTAHDMVVSNGPVVFTPGDPAHDPPEIDAADRERWVDATVSWLDRHLSDLEDGGEGLLDEVAMAGLVDGDEEAVAVATSELTGPDRPLEDATYELLVGVDGDVQWIRAVVRTVTGEGETATTFVFAPDEELQLVAVGEGGVDAPEADVETEGPA